MCIYIYIPIQPKVPNKQPPQRLICFFKKIRPPLPPSPPLLLVPSPLARNKIEQRKTYLSIRNSIKSKEIDFLECFFVFNFIFK